MNARIQNPAELLARLSIWNPDEPGAPFSFSKRLARDNAWSHAYALKVIEEYKRFACLAVAAGHPVTPSDQVDQAWHLHLLYTESYWNEFCPDVLGCPLHHGPTKGGGAQREQFHAQYLRTLESYRRVFGTEPPEDIWPGVHDRFGRDIRFARINTDLNWVIPKPRLRVHLARQIARLRHAWSAVCARRQGLCESEPPGNRHVARCIKWGTIVLLCATGANAAGMSFLVADQYRGPTLPWTLYLVGFGLAAWLRWVFGGPSGEPSRGVPMLDAQETAFLVGGSRRALELALVSLVRRGATELDDSRTGFRRAGPKPKIGHPLEQKIYEVLECERSEAKGVKEIEQRVEPTLERIRGKLEEHGLLPGEGRKWLAVGLPLLIVATLSLVTLSKMATSTDSGGKMENSDALFGFFMGGLFLGLACFANPPQRTRRGKRWLARLQAANNRGEANGFRNGSDTADLIHSLALLGLVALEGTDMQEVGRVLQAARRENSTGTYCDCGCGSSGAEGGGDGGCGGGCGGCGGCG